MVPDEKMDLIDSAATEVATAHSNYEEGYITDNERYNKVIDIWTRTNNSVSEAGALQISVGWYAWINGETPKKSGGFCR